MDGVLYVAEATQWLSNPSWETKRLLEWARNGAAGVGADLPRSLLLREKPAPVEVPETVNWLRDETDEDQEYERSGREDAGSLVAEKTAWTKPIEAGWSALSRVSAHCTSIRSTRAVRHTTAVTKRWASAASLPSSDRSGSWHQGPAEQKQERA